MELWAVLPASEVGNLLVETCVNWRCFPLGDITPSVEKLLIRRVSLGGKTFVFVHISCLQTEGSLVCLWLTLLASEPVSLSRSSTPPPLQKMSISFTFQPPCLQLQPSMVGSHSQDSSRSWSPILRFPPTLVGLSPIHTLGPLLDSHPLQCSSVLFPGSSMAQSHSWATSKVGQTILEWEGAGNGTEPY